MCQNESLVASLRTELQQRKVQIADLTDLLYDEDSVSAIDWKNRCTQIGKYRDEALTKLRAKEVERAEIERSLHLNNTQMTGMRDVLKDKDITIKELYGKNHDLTEDLLRLERERKEWEEQNEQNEQPEQEKQEEREDTEYRECEIRAQLQGILDDTEVVERYRTFEYYESTLNLRDLDSLICEVRQAIRGVRV